MLCHIRQSRKQPIVQLDRRLPVYALRLVKKIDSHETITYSSEGYAVLAQVGDKWFCHRCPNWEICLHRALLYKCWRAVEHLRNEIQAVGDTTTHIYKPQPSRRNLYMCRPREERMLFRCETCEQAPRQTLVCDGIQLGSAS